MSHRKLYLFNPDSDLALANGETNYMPPAAARQLAADLALLPAWYADGGSAVLAPSAYNEFFLESMQALLPLSVTLVTERALLSSEQMIPASDAWVPSPWGWNPALRRRWQRLGMIEATLPTDRQLEAYRHLSHRSRAVELLPRLQEGEDFCGESCYLTEPADWKHFVEAREVSLLKAPLSGSGKGLNWCKGVFTPFISGWCDRVAAVQGGVVAEPVYDKVEDFAMEFVANEQGEVHFVGYSLFETGSGGAYEGSLLLSDEAIEHRLSHYVRLEALRALQLRLQQELSLLLNSGYTGYLGVDMMICRFEEASLTSRQEQPTHRIHPCVEINLRMNMGVVARLLYDRYVAEDSQGVFRVSYHSAAEEALQAHRQMEAAHPLQIADGKVVSGYLPLVPVTVQSRYRAWALVDAASPLSFP